MPLPRKRREDKDSDDARRKPRRRNDQEDEDRVVISDSDDEDEIQFRPVLFSKDRRRRERKADEMTEEEMLDLAVRLSEQEASNAALRLEEEEEAVRKAIEESLIGDPTSSQPNAESPPALGSSTQLCPPVGSSSQLHPPSSQGERSTGQSLPADPHTAALSSRRQLAYPSVGGAAAEAGGARGSLGTGAGQGGGDEKRGRRRQNEGGHEKPVETHSVNGLEVCSLNGEDFIELPEVFTQSAIPVSKENIPTEKDVRRWPYLKDAHLNSIRAEVELLIGANVPKAMEPLKVINSQGEGPYAVLTRLGWTVGGALGSVAPVDGHGRPRSTSSRISVAGLEDLLAQRQKQDFPEAAYSKKQEHSVEDKRFLEVVDTSTTRKNGHYEIRKRAMKPLNLWKKRGHSLQTHAKSEPPEPLTPKHLLQMRGKPTLPPGIFEKDDDDCYHRRRHITVTKAHGAHYGHVSRQSGHVRRVKVKTQNGTLDRPITKLCLLKDMT